MQHILNFVNKHAATPIQDISQIQNRLNTVVTYLETHFTRSFTENQKLALTSLILDIGMTAFQSSYIPFYLEENNMQAAIQTIKTYIKEGRVNSVRKITRRNEEIKLLLEEN